MLSLILFRHGKSDWSTDKHDHDRPLAPRGERAAKAMGKFIAMSEQVPPLVITSSAKRARDTLHLAIRQGDWDSLIKVESALYEASAKSVIKIIKDVENAPKRLMLVGHETTWSELTSRLTDNHGKFRFPTGAMARIDFAIDDWSELEEGNGEFRWLIPPKVFTKTEWR